MAPARLKQLPEEEPDRRIQRASDPISKKEADTAVLFNSASKEFLTGFNHVQTINAPLAQR